MNTGDQTSDDTLARAAQHSPADFAPLYRRYVSNIYRYMFSRTGCAADAEDLTSQVFLDALRNIKNYRPGTNFTAWLFTIAHRRVIDLYRVAPDMLPLGDNHPEEADDILGGMEKDDDRLRIRQLTSTCSPEEQELIRLHYAADLTYAEMAIVLNRSQGAIKMAMSRLTQKLKQQWEVQE